MPGKSRKRPKPVKKLGAKSLRPVKNLKTPSGPSPIPIPYPN